MPPTPLAAKTLSRALLMHTWQQSDLAKLSGIDRAQVNMHINNARPIRDGHLAAYCQALDKTEQASLVAAWLRDVLSEQSQAAVLNVAATTLSEDVRAWQPSLDQEQRSMIRWWEQQLASDTELDEIFRAISRKAGWDTNA